MLLYSVLTVSTNFLSTEGALADGYQRIIFLSDLFVKFEGAPADWKTTDVRTIGLAGENGLVEAAKLEELGKLSYEEAAAKLNLGPYDFYLNITRIDGGLIYSYGRLGNATSTFSMRRLARVHNTTTELAVVHAIIWRENR